ncbi:hypothetical protein [Pseudoalteromonas phage PS_L5]|nr:hypothetical protein [Pseudoalteromonas phage PS_L5]
MSKRKSFLIYIDSLPVLDDLTDEQAGKLFKAISSYHKGEDLELDSLTKIAFSPFKSQFIRDDEKYQKIVERNKNNGLRGGRPKTEDNPEKPSGLNGNPTNPKKADSDSDSDSDSDIKPIVEAKPQRSKFSFNDNQMRFSEAVYNKIKLVTPKMKKPNLESWANSARLLNETDGIDLNEAWKVFCWANADSFWSTNILSLSKFREKYATLEAKMKAGPNQYGGKSQQARTKVKEFKL